MIKDREKLKNSLITITDNYEISTDNIEVINTETETINQPKEYRNLIAESFKGIKLGFFEKQALSVLSALYEFLDQKYPNKNALNTIINIFDEDSKINTEKLFKDMAEGLEQPENRKGMILTHDYNIRDVGKRLTTLPNEEREGILMTAKSLLRKYMTDNRNNQITDKRNVLTDSSKFIKN